MPATATLATPSAAETFLLGADDLARFERDGYVVARGLVPDAMRAEMLTVTLEELSRDRGPREFEAELQYPGAPQSRDDAGGNTLRRLKQAHARHPVFTRWLGDPALGGRLRQLLGGRVVCPLAHHNCIMTKLPRHSSDTGWHQDVRYWSFERPELVSSWLALGPETRENGCLQLVPGSHRQTYARDRFDDDLFLREDLDENRALLAGAVHAELEPGDVLFFHARTFHAATRNHTDQPKFSVVFTFRPEDNRPRPGTRSSSLPEILLPEVEPIRDAGRPTTV
jgi:phytanoyl-CoA hydroxylase